MIYLYNTLTRKKEVFRPIHEGEVRIYSCGPTVYYFPHLGNMRAFLFDDFLHRMFLYNGYKVDLVINITDVGHLVSDADEGEDKLMKAIRRDGLPVNAESMLLIAKKYTDAFIHDCDILNILAPTHMPSASKHIQEMIDLIGKIEKKGAAYRTNVALMFDISKYPQYAELGKLDLSGQREGVREEVVVDAEKRNPQDFALWFFGKPTHVMQWDSPWGRGFPGWHIECSAMSTKYLGEHFDIHTGGVDHICVHHTNERAQSEMAFGHKWVDYWMHNEHLTVDKQKMAKSLGTSITLQTVLDKGYDPLAFRLLVLNSHYRSKMNFSWDAMDTAQNSLNNLRDKVLELKQLPDSNPSDNDYSEQFLKAINDDLNTPAALAVLWAVVKDSELGSIEKLNLVLGFDKVFGLGLEKVEHEELPADLMEIVKERDEARKKKDWKKSDELRDLLKEKGVLVEDTADGTKWKRVL